MGAVTIEKPARTSAVLSRQTVREGVVSGLQLSRTIFAGLGQRHVVITMALALLLIASAVGVVVAAHDNRALFNTLSGLHAERDGYQREWSQLLLEQSALSAHGRIEQQAAGQLGMVVPGKDSIVLVPGTVAGTN
ncbi:MULTISPECIES: cell division protein FtsL [Marinobacter]|uniref:Cell division protein FtsL n=1 Tax=Marinobacter profundi TaxID=2666256 RepID=A0A2G1UKS8_9GAMM|nr:MULTISPECIES: cell division protein FtsL [Marinobacter]MBD3657891.1 cell division protein FtsL [Marinobacter sp.]PHQ15029.1 cell division protein FtsL [Marinobacter profundi]